MEVLNFIPCLLLATSISISGVSPCVHGEMTAMPDCAGYRMCVWGNFYDTPCPEGTAWNQDMLTCVHQGSSADPCTSHCDWQYKMIPWSDCTGFDWCVNYQVIEMGENGRCANGTLFSSTERRCVWANEQHDCVDDDPADLSIEEQCAVPDQDHIAHPTECQLYYDCDDDIDDESLYQYAGPMGSVRVKYLKECLFPQLYNQDTGGCDDYKNVDCGDRLEIKYVCRYRRSACGGSHCIPCSVSAGSCEGLEDGLNAHSGKPGSPYYVVCEDGRTQSHETCGKDASGYTMLFDQDTRQCVSQLI